MQFELSSAASMVSNLRVIRGGLDEAIESTDVRPLTNDARREVLQSCEGQALACLRSISVILVYIERI